MKNSIILSIVAAVLFFLYSYKLLEVPTGLTVDEASFGYNAALLSQTGRDERGLPHPIFVLYQDGKDWRQPLTQYYLAALFKVFGSSVFLLRASSVIIAVFSVIALYFLAQTLLPGIAALVAALTLVATPILMIQAHLGLDNIMPVPFVILWLFSFWRYRRDRNSYWLVICALSLGFSFYSYKGMRAITPIWIGLTLIWLFADWYRKRATSRNLVLFGITLAPFFLIIPHLERNYAGAILGNAVPGFNTYYDFFRAYLSSFDLSALFIRGDSTIFHSTGRHGMLLLASLPLVITGIYAATRSKNTFFRFILLSLILGPALFGTVGSEHRFSRLLALLPLYALLSGLGFQFLNTHRFVWARAISFIVLFLMVLNYFDFTRFYWRDYPGLTRDALGDMSYFRDLDKLKQQVKETGFEPTIHRSLGVGGGETAKFFQLVYFSRLLRTIPDDQGAQEGILLFTHRQEIPCMEEVGQSKSDYHILKTRTDCFPDRL